MNPDARPTSARLVIGRADSRSAAVSWQAAGDDADREGRRPVQAAAGVDLVAVRNEGRDLAELEIADVIWLPGTLSPALSAAWLVQTLDRFPGCMIAAVGQIQRKCMVAGRGQSSI